MVQKILFTYNFTVPFYSSLFILSFNKERWYRVKRNSFISNSEALQRNLSVGLYNYISGLLWNRGNYPMLLIFHSYNRERLRLVYWIEYKKKQTNNMSASQCTLKSFKRTVTDLFYHAKSTVCFLLLKW